MIAMSDGVRGALMLGTLLLSQGRASAHFLWVDGEPVAGGATTIRVFLNETPEPGGPEFLRFVRELRPTVEGRPLAVRMASEAVEASWVGLLPPRIDAERDLGVRAKEGHSTRLVYSARLQSSAAKVGDPEAGASLRVRWVQGDAAGDGALQVLFDGKPLAKARIKLYPENGEAAESATDETGLAKVAGLAEGKAPLWANWVDGVAGEVGGKAFEETRYYATLTVCQVRTGGKTAFAAMPTPAVNSFGGAVLEGWLYVYGGHVGKTHEYSVETTSRHFRRLNLGDRRTWEDLPMGPDVQGVALVTDGRFLYRLGGMAARNASGEEHDLHSVADFARYDPEAKTWIDLTPLPVPRSTHDAIVMGRTIYAVGGWRMKGATEDAEYLPDTVAFDLDRPEAGWRSIPQPFRRRALSVAEAGGKLYVLGGLTDKMDVRRGVDVYDPATGAWSAGPEIPAGHRQEGFGTSAFSVEGRPYFSGASGWIYRLDDLGTGWEAVGAWSMPRITHRLLAGPGRSLLAVGGNSGGKQVPLIESVTLPGVAGETSATGDAGR